LNGSLGGSHADNFTRIGTQLRERFTAQAGITLSVPILDRHRTKSKLTQSRISLRQAELQGRQNEILLRQTVLQEYHNVISSANSFETSGIRERAYRASLETCRRQFEAGSITTIELLQQQNNHITAVNDYVRDKYSFLLKRKILDVYMGEFN
jgi:outer membrane protein